MFRVIVALFLMLSFATLGVARLAADVGGATLSISPATQAVNGGEPFSVTIIQDACG